MPCVKINGEIESTYTLQRKNASAETSQVCEEPAEFIHDITKEKKHLTNSYL